MRICYINITKKIPPRDAVYLKGLEKNGCEILYCNDNSNGFFKKIWQILKKHSQIKNNYDILWVGYTAHTLVPIARLMTSKKVVFNALGSLYEGKIISRNQAQKFSIKSTYYWLVDFLAFHSASISLVESDKQKIWLEKKFYIRSEKLMTALTGADDSIFLNQSPQNKLPTFCVLFRGGFLPESGVEYAARATKILQNENIKFRIIGNGMMANEVKTILGSFDSKKVEWITENLEQSDLTKMMRECHLSLGQLSDHDRLLRTIPHKAFESIAMKIPYLTARNPGVLEILEENKTCACCNPADPQDLADKILLIKNNYGRYQEISENAYKLYVREMSSEVLAKKVLERIAHLT